MAGSPPRDCPNPFQPMLRPWQLVRKGRRVVPRRAWWFGHWEGCTVLYFLFPFFQGSPIAEYQIGSHPIEEWLCHGPSGVVWRSECSTPLGSAMYALAITLGYFLSNFTVLRK